MNMYLTIYKIHFVYKEADIFNCVILYEFTGYKRIKSFDFNIADNVEKYIYLDAENNTIAVTDNPLNVNGYHIAHLKIKRRNNNIEILESPDSSLMYFVLQDESIYIRHLKQEVLDYIRQTSQNITNNALSNLTINLSKLEQDVLNYIETTSRNIVNDKLNSLKINIPNLEQDVLDYIHQTSQNITNNAINNLVINLPKLGQDVLDYIQHTALDITNYAINNLKINLPKLDQDVLNYIQEIAQNYAYNAIHNSSFHVIVITDNYNVDINDDYILCNNTTDIILTLPTITQNTRQKLITIKKINSGNVTIQTSNDQLIDRTVTSFTLIDSGQLIRLLPVNETIGWVIV